MKGKQGCMLVVLALAASSAYAAGHWSDGRNDAMGGIGVASSAYSSAAVVNPALVSKWGADDDFSIVLPSVGAQVTDKDKLIDNIDSIKASYDGFEQAVGSGVGVSAAADQLAADLRQVDGKTATANVGVNVQAVLPSNVLSVGAFANGYAVGMVGAKVDQSDLDYLMSVSDGSALPDGRTLNSQAVGVVALVQDYGVALAREFDVGLPVRVGVAPKAQKIETYNYSATITDYDRSDLSDDKYRSSDSGFNADLGLALDAGSMTYGLSVHDLVSRDVYTKDVAGTIYVYQVAPVATLGAAYRGDVLTAGIDLDMNKTKGFVGQEQSQFAGVGVEFDAAKWAQLRAGYRTDISGEQPDLFTAGFGLSPWDVFHLDLTGQIGSDKAVGAGLAMRWTF